MSYSPDSRGGHNHFYSARMVTRVAAALGIGAVLYGMAHVKNELYIRPKEWLKLEGTKHLHESRFGKIQEVAQALGALVNAPAESRLLTPHVVAIEPDNPLELVREQPNREPIVEALLPPVPQEDVAAAN